MAKNEQQEILTRPEAARLLSVSIPTLDSWRRVRQGPRFVKLGSKSVRYRRADLEAFVESGVVSFGNSSKK